MPTETLRLTTSDGVVLDGDLDRAEAPSAAVIVLHPHPQYGGDRRSHVVQGIRRRLVSESCMVATFDFRGVGRSTGAHGDGIAERLDVEATIEAVRDPALPLVVVGYSFGSLVALAVDDPTIAGWVAVAPPLGDTAPLAANDPRPKLVLAATHDQFCPAGRAESLTAGWTATTFTEVPQADHFLAGRMSVVEDAVAAFVRSVAAR